MQVRAADHIIALIARLGHGLAPLPTVDSPVRQVDSTCGDAVIARVHLAAAILDSDRPAVSWTNRGAEPLAVDIPLDVLGRFGETRAVQAQHDDLMAVNTWEQPPGAAPASGQRRCTFHPPGARPSRYVAVVATIIS